MRQRVSRIRPPSPPAGEGGFGTFNGVFMPTLLTILGAVMYLRTGWVVGNAGLGGGLVIILLANVITISTGLSISSIATNIRVRAGGAFSIISQSLGLEVGGSVSVPFYLAQAISVAFYIFAFSEGWQRIFPEHPLWLVVFASFGACFAIASISVKLVTQVRYPILFIITASLISISLGSFADLGGVGLKQQPEIWGEFSSGHFWQIFAVFFPAATGILTGVNMSGTLKDPRRSIPRGVMAAIILSMFVYMGLAVWVAYVATPAELIGNVTIMVDRAWYGPAVLVGILAATFSAALNSLASAPRVLQPIAQYGILPGGQIFARQTASGEPRPAMYLTGAIGLGTILFGLVGGGLNAIAPLMTMFFLIVYAMLNAVIMLEQMAGLVSFRPLFPIPRLVPVIGLVGCVFAMFLINPIFSLAAVTIIILFYSYLSRRDLQAPWSDVRSGLFVTLSEWAAKRVISLPTSQERAWKPSLLVPVRSAQSLLGSYRFIRALTAPRGSVHVLGLYYAEEKERLRGLESFVYAFANDNIFARMVLLEMKDYAFSLRTSFEILRGVFFRPNILLLSITHHTEEATLQFLLDRAEENEIGAILFAQHPEAGLGQEQTINVWIRDQSPDWEVGLRLSNLDLALLLAYQLARNWGGTITLITLVADPQQQANGEAFMVDLLKVGRMPRPTRTVVEVDTLQNYLPRSPRADLNVFGLQDQVSLDFIERMVTETEASCIFVRDSGQESALA